MDPRGSLPAALRACGVGALALALAAGCGTSAPAPRPLHDLPVSGTWRGTIDFADPARVDFRLELPDDAVVTRVAFECAEVALELHAQPGERIDAPSDAPWTIDADDATREFVLDRLGSDAVAGATWCFAADWPFEDPPRGASGRLERAGLR